LTGGCPASAISICVKIKFRSRRVNFMAMTHSLNYYDITVD
jgi:hypothetical protein